MSQFEHQLAPMLTGNTYQRSEIFSKLQLNEVKDFNVPHQSAADKKNLREEIMEVLSAYSGHSENQSERPENDASESEAFIQKIVTAKFEKNAEVQIDISKDPKIMVFSFREITIKPKITMILESNVF
jgi:hypothetical protein